MLQIKIRLLELAARLVNYNSFKDTVKKYEDLCTVIGLNDYKASSSFEPKIA